MILNAKRVSKVDLLTFSNISDEETKFDFIIV